MSRPENAAALALLREISAVGVPFVVVGSAGLGLLHPHVLEQEVLDDVDIIVADTDALRRLLRWLEPRGFEARVWGEAIDGDVADDALRGRFYVRARRGDLQLDITYEDSPFDVDTAIADAVIVDGVPVCPEAWLWRGKRRKDASAARAFAARHGLTPVGDEPAESLPDPGEETLRRP